jgi:hypothetical protein
MLSIPNPSTTQPSQQANKTHPYYTEWVRFASCYYHRVAAATVNEPMAFTINVDAPLTDLTLTWLDVWPSCCYIYFHATQMLLSSAPIWGGWKKWTYKSIGDRTKFAGKIWFSVLLNNISCQGSDVHSIRNFQKYMPANWNFLAALWTKMLILCMLSSVIYITSFLRFQLREDTDA